MQQVTLGTSGDPSKPAAARLRPQASIPCQAVPHLVPTWAKTEVAGSAERKRHALLCARLCVSADLRAQSDVNMKQEHSRRVSGRASGLLFVLA